jgi:hypothetical protein
LNQNQLTEQVAKTAEGILKSLLAIGASADVRIADLFNVLLICGELFAATKAGSLNAARSDGKSDSTNHSNDQNQSDNSLHFDFLRKIVCELSHRLSILYTCY